MTVTVSATHDSTDHISEWRIEAEIYENINDERASRGLQMFEYSPALSNAAEQNVKRMAEIDRLEHTDNLIQTFRSEGDDCWSASQNIAYGYMNSGNEEDLADKFVEMWMNSPPHRKNILSDYSREGLAIEVDGERVYASQNFCS